MEPAHPAEPGATPPTSTPARAPRSSAPAWLWGLVLCSFSVIFWWFLPQGARPVPYSPWFLDQVEAGTIQAISIQGLEIRGVLRATTAFGPGASGRRFVTHFPSEQSIEPMVQRLRTNHAADGPIQIETHPPREGGMVHLILLLQVIALLVIALVLAGMRTGHR